MRRFLFCLAPLLAGSACATFEGEWLETGPVRRSHEEAWTTCIGILRDRQGFKIGEQSRSKGRISTHWKTQLAPMYREGTRVRAELEILPLEEGGYNIRVRCPFEINNNSWNPMSRKDADWVSAGGDENLAIRIRTLLRMKLRGMTLDD